MTSQQKNLLTPVQKKMLKWYFGMAIAMFIMLLPFQKLKKPEKLTCLPDRNPINGNSLCSVFSQMNIDLMFQSPFFQQGTNMCFFFSEKNQFPVFGIFVGSGCPADIYRFQNIGLSLGIIPIENIGFRIKIQIQ